MTNTPSGKAPKPGFDVAEAPFEITEQTAAPTGPVVEGEAEDEELKRRQESALASTFDPALAKSGKTDEEIDKHKHDEALLVAGAAIVTAAIMTHEAPAHGHDGDGDEAALHPDAHDTQTDGGDHSG